MNTLTKADVLEAVSRWLDKVENPREVALTIRRTGGRASADELDRQRPLAGGAVFEVVEETRATTLFALVQP